MFKTVLDDTFTAEMCHLAGCSTVGYTIHSILVSVLPAGDPDITVLVYVAGALPAELQGHRGEVTGCSLHHQFPY